MFCPSCGTEYAIGLPYCNRCGANLGGMVAPQTEPAVINVTKPTLIISVTLAVLTLGGFAGLIEGAELTAVRTGLFAAGEMEPVKRMVIGETGAAYRVTTAHKIRDLMVFALSEDLHLLRRAVGTQVEVHGRKG